jgi:hypothetical protein
MAVVLLLANQFVLHRDENKSAAAASVATPIPGKSIAVLPFRRPLTEARPGVFLRWHG